MSRPLSRFVLGFLAALLLVSRAQGATDVTYTVRDLGTLGGANSRAHAINEQGWVVGEAETSEGHLRAFLWTPENGMQDLGACGGETSRAYDVNERGQVAGEAEDAQGRLRPFRWSADQGLEELPLPEGFLLGFVFGLNNFGVLVGGGENEAGTRALVWSVDGVAIPEALRHRGASLAHAVNDLGDIAGQVEDEPAGSYVSRAFLLGAGGLRMPDDGGSPEWSSAALAIAADARAVGYAERSNATHAIRYHATAVPPEDLDTLDNVYSIAHDINADGVVVGLFVSSNEDEDRAFVSRDGVMTDLNELIETDEPWLIVEARGINRAGQIVGYGLLRDRERAVLLEPRGVGSDPRPRIRIAAPAPGQRLVEGEPLTLEAAVDSADRNVRRVTFFSSGVVLGSVTNPPYRLTWDRPPAGTHHLVASVMNKSGRIRRSARVPIVVEIPRETRPAVALLEPDDGTALATGASLWIGAEAFSDSPTTCTVRLLLNGVEMAATNGTALGLEWRPLETGLHTWVAIAQDAQGAAATSAPARVHVTTPEGL